MAIVIPTAGGPQAHRYRATALKENRNRTIKGHLFQSPCSYTKQLCLPCSQISSCNLNTLCYNPRANLSLRLKQVIQVMYIEAQEKQNNQQEVISQSDRQKNQICGNQSGTEYDHNPSIYFPIRNFIEKRGSPCYPISCLIHLHYMPLKSKSRTMGWPRDNIVHKAMHKLGNDWLHQQYDADPMAQLQRSS